MRSWALRFRYRSPTRRGHHPLRSLARRVGSNPLSTAEHTSGMGILVTSMTLVAFHVRVPRQPGDRLPVSET